MNGQTMTAKKYGNRLLTAFVLVFASMTSQAQVPVDEDGNTLPAYYEDDIDTIRGETTAPESGTVLSTSELETLVGPIALYPDDLLAVVLPASAYPLEIVQAARFLDRLENDSSLKPDDEWDDSIVALLNYPDVVHMMNDDIDWTWRLGEAVISQQDAVIAAVEAFRDRAYAAGNLKTDENQTVTYSEGTIEIAPVDEEIIYVPYYEPAEVVVYQSRPVYHYYPDPYPVYYYPYPVGYGFRSGYFWGVTTAFSIGWSNHYLHVYHPTYWGHPYYGRTYYNHYYRRPSINVYNNWYVNNSYRASNYRYRDGDYWRPRTRAGSRQDEPRVRNYHYPPNGDTRQRDNANARSALDNRRDGRLALDLRERSDSGRRRVATGNDATRRTNDTNRRVTTSDRGTASPRTSVNRDTSTRTASDNRARTTDATRAVGRANTDRPTTSGSQGNDTGQRESTTRRDIQFRDRGATGSRVRPSADSGTSRPAASGSPDTRSAAPQQRTPRITAPRQPTAGSTAPGSTSQRQSAPRAVAPRSSTPRVTAPRTSAPRVAAPRASAPRTSAPRVAAPRTSAPRVAAPRTSAPRTSAPRVTAPRASAPRATAPRTSAPRASAPKASGTAPARASSPRGSNSRRSSRPRTGSN